MITYQQCLDEINDHVDPNDREFYIRYATNVHNATHLTAEEKQRKYEILLRAIGVYVETKNANSPLTIVVGTIKGTFEDLFLWLGGVGKNLMNITDLLTKPMLFIPLALLIGAFAIWIFSKRVSFKYEKTK